MKISGKRMALFGNAENDSLAVSCLLRGF